jgi:hypothetical protein
MTLIDALQGADMLLIDDLHAFDFSVDPATGLKVEAMDGRALKRWEFNAAQLAGAVLQDDGQAYRVEHAGGTARLVCMSAFAAAPEDETEQA